MATIFLPGFLLGLVSCWHRGILKTFIAHPSILLMPTFTHFAFASSTKWCKRSQEEEEGQEEGEEEEEGERQEKTDPYIAFSTKATVCNLLLAVSGIVYCCLSKISEAEYLLEDYIDKWSDYPGYQPPTLLDYLGISFLIFTVVSILGVLFTVLSLVLNSTRPKTYFQIQKYKNWLKFCLF